MSGHTKICRQNGTHGTMAPILLVVGGAKVKLAQALVPRETSAM